MSKLQADVYPVFGTAELTEAAEVTLCALGDLSGCFLLLLLLGLNLADCLSNGILVAVVFFGRVGLLLYQAGADAHQEDPLGGWMDADQMRRQDRIVFEHCQRAAVPLVWNLAGGYQEDFQRVLDLHHATTEECQAVFRS